MIAFIFAIVTMSNATPTTSLPVFKEVTTDRLFEDNQKNNIRNYTTIRLRKIEMESDIASKGDVLWADVPLKTELFFNTEAEIELIEKLVRIRPDYTILARYKNRVLRN